MNETEIRRLARERLEVEGYPPLSAILIDKDLQDPIVFDECCDECGRRFGYVVDNDRYWKWMNREMLIQDAMPGIKPEYREILKSHICGRCWKKMFGPPPARRRA